jgi:hypothetical protein
MQRITTMLTMAGFALILGAFGTMAGSAAQTAFSPEPVLASCEDTECENNSCIDNPGGDTSCNQGGAECRTQGCGLEPDISN